MPIWIPITLAVIHVLSHLWFLLVIKDTRKFVDSQLWVVSDAHSQIIQTKGLMWIKRIYGATLLIWIPITFILLYS